VKARQTRTSGLLPPRVFTNEFTVAHVYLNTKRYWSSAVFITCVAFLVRLAILVLTRISMPTSQANTPYGYEAGHVAASIASGRGFTAPLSPIQTGATAWLVPIYPYLMAGIFKIWGIFSIRSRLILQIINCAFSALTILPIYAIAKRTFGTGSSVFASWLWVFLPNAWHVPIADIWDTSLTALVFASIFWATETLSDQRRLSLWIGYGALWAAGAMVNPSILSVMPFLLAWLVWETRKRSSASFSLSLALVALLTCVLGLAPWTLRNYRTFHKWIPLRSNFGLELWLGNNAGTQDVNSFSQHPALNPAEAAQLTRLGEVAYMALKQHEALVYMRSHPAVTLARILHRVATNWFAVTDRPESTWSSVSSYMRGLFVLNVLLILFSWFGAIIAFHIQKRQAMPYVLVLLIFPLAYYLTHTLVRYSFPMDPLLVILSANGVATVFAWTRDWQFRARTASTFAR
jgi:Dolichyl-phosphate-mannose-protein mannosyltransferase